MVCSEADSQLLGACSSLECTKKLNSRSSSRKQRHLHRSSSVPGKRHRCQEVIIRRQQFEQMQKDARSAEQQALEQRYNVLDAIVKLDYECQQLRRGKSFDLPDLSPSCFERGEGAIPTLGRRSSHCGALQSDRPDSHFPSRQRSCSLSKLPQISDSMSPESSGKLELSGKLKKTSAGSKHKSSKGCEASQLETLRALVASVDVGKPLADPVCSLSRHILTHLGEKAFTVEQRELAVIAALKAIGLDQEPPLEEAPQERVELVVQALRIVAAETKMNFSGVVGQVLWRHRKADALQKKKHKDAIEDLSWIVPDAKQAEQLQVVDEVFTKLSDGHGRMNSKGWSQIVRLIGSSPVLADRISRSDVDRLWYTQTRSNSSKDTGLLRDIDLSDFKALLLSLGESMKVHPWMIFLAVASYSGSGSATPSRSSTPSKLTLPSPNCSSRGSSRSNSSNLKLSA